MEELPIYKRLYIRLSENQQLFIAYFETVKNERIVPHIVFARKDAAVEKPPKDNAVEETAEKAE